MQSQRIKALNTAVRQVLEPALAPLGFDYEAASRTFRRRAGGCTHIVNVQAGVKSLQGRFAVNLGAFHPEYWADTGEAPQPERPMEYHCLARQRLSMLRRTVITSIFRPLVRSREGFMAWWLTTPTDKWWHFGDDEVPTMGQMQEVRALLLGEGMDWFAAHGTLAALHAAHSRAAKARIGSG